MKFERSRFWELQADNVWRADKIGEFAPVYRALAASAQKTDANPAALKLSPMI